MFASIARHGDNPRYGLPMRLAFGRGFSGRRAISCLVIYEPRRIAYAQIYPFLAYRDAFAARFDAEIRLLPANEARAGIPKRFHGASHVITQSWLVDPPENFAAIRKRIDELPGRPRLAYIDCFANADIRLAADLDEFGLYYKKSLLRTSDDMLRETIGDTTLTEYYGQLYGIEQAPVHWGVQESFLERLRLSPNFLTAPDLMPGFLGAPPPGQGASRGIDLHARLGGLNVPNWYGAMRRDAQARVEALTDLTLAVGSGIPRAAFMDELRQSKICFSPFGFGEVCWRDIEAMLTGAVLLKPDMSHLWTEPDLFRDNETYVSVAWDFSDFEETVRALLADPERCGRIARKAWKVARAYLQSDGPVETYADIFAT